MVLEELCIERDSHTSESLHFNCMAKQIRIVDLKRIQIPESKTSRTRPKQKKGLQESKPVSVEKAEAIKKDNSFIFGGPNKLFGN